MKFQRLLLAGVALMLASSAATGAPFDKTPAKQRDINIRKLMRSMAPNADITSSQRTQRINEMTTRFNNRFAGSKAAGQDITKPEKTFGPNANLTDIDGPNGELWYYTTTLKSTTVEFEYYSEEILQEYQFDIYNSRFELIGTIHDKMRYADDEVAVPGPLSGIDLLPVVTKNYFNNDEKLELVVSLAINTIYPGYNRYRSIVYSLDGEKEEVMINRDGTEVKVEVDKPVTQYNAFITDVLNASTATEENFYLTFSNDIYNSENTEATDFDYDEDYSYWEQLSTIGSSYYIYSKTGADGQLTKIFDRYLPYIQMQGDQQSTPPMLTFTRDGVSYLLYPYYREPYFNQVNDYNEDLSMREGNSLIIELYKLTPEKAELCSTTELPVVKLEEEGLLGNYYGVGELGYSRDINFDENGQPLYTVTRSNYLAGQDDTTGFCYYVYDAKGNKVKTIFENADSDLTLYSIPGFNDQHMFVSYNDVDGYNYHMVDLTTGCNDSTVKINYLLDAGLDEPEVMLFNMDRVAVGDSYKYAFEIKVPYVDESSNNTFMRIAWFNADGSFDRVDNINMGHNIQYAQSFMNGAALSPHLFNADDQHEYMILVKRGTSAISTDSQEEFLIAQPASEDFTGGNTLMHLVPDADKGILSTIGLYPGATADESRMMIGYLNYEDYSYTVDFYSLPLDIYTAINKPAAGSKPSGIAFNGTTLTAKGQEICVYSATGSLAATGRGTLAVDMLPAGLYIATAGKSVSKFIIK